MQLLWMRVLYYYATNLTAQRVNNEYTHTFDNIVAYCKGVIVVANSGWLHITKILYNQWSYVVAIPMFFVEVLA